VLSTSIFAIHLIKADRLELWPTHIHQQTISEPSTTGPARATFNANLPVTLSTPRIIRASNTRLIRAKLTTTLPPTTELTAQNLERETLAVSNRHGPSPGIAGRYCELRNGFLCDVTGHRFRNPQFIAAAVQMAHHFLNGAISDKREADTQEFRRVATSFLTCSCDVSDTWVRLFLIYHAIECALKAHLAKDGALTPSLRNTHDITILAPKAASHGLVLTPEDNRSLLSFTSCSKDGRTEDRPSIALRYSIGGGATSESPDVLKRIAESIIDQIKP
jgi:hypothetical protein